MAKGVSCLLPHQYTFHIGLELLRVLTKLLFFLVPTVPGHPDNPSPDSTAHRSTLSTAASIATQLSSSGLLQQLPAMLQRGQQQLSSLDAFGYCGVPDCRYCSRDKRSTTSKGVTNAALKPVQAHLLDFCSQVINMWPGGALSSAAVGPLLVPAAELALGSLQTATRLVQARPDSSIVPSEGMRQLGNAAFNMCFTLCSAAAAIAKIESVQRKSTAGSSSSSNSGRLPRFAQQLLEDPVMLPVAVVLGSSAVYREHLFINVKSAQTRAKGTADCSTGTTTGSSACSSRNSAEGPGSTTATPTAGEDISRCVFNAVMYQVVPIGPDAEVPAAAWQLLTAQERQLSAGQSLLPDLQQQLLSTLDCSAKAFLWLSGAGNLSSCPWQGFRSVILLETVASAVHRICSAKLLATQQQIQPHELQQLLLLPALLLRWAVHKQQEGRQVDGMYCTLSAVDALINITASWRGLVAKAAKQQEQPQQLQVLLQEWHGRQGQSEGPQLPAAVLHELLLLLTHQMQWAFQAKPDFSSLVAAGRAREECVILSPESAVDILAGAIAYYLPAATRAVTSVEVNTGAGRNSSRVGGSEGGSSSSSSSGGRVPGTRTASAEVDWVGLLLRMLPILERSIRFQAQHSPKEDLAVSGEFYQRYPCGPTWTCVFLLASCVGHAEFESRETQSVTEATHAQLDLDDSTTRPSLLQWLLSQVAAAQADTARQRVHGLLSTAIKCIKPPTKAPHEQASLQLLKATADTVWDVMCQLKPPVHQGPGAAGLLPGGTGAARPAATGQGTEPSAKAQAAPLPARHPGSNPSIPDAGNSSTAAPSADPNAAASSAVAGSTQGTPPAAALPWIALLGRCWCVFVAALV